MSRPASATLDGAPGRRRAFFRVCHPALVLPTLKRRGKKADRGRTTGPSGELRAGQLNAAIANDIGKLIADFTGRGSEKSRAFIAGDVVVRLLENGATRGEQNIAAAGRADVVRLGRDILRRALEDQLAGAVERLTGRKVRTFLSGSSTPGESAVEMFVLEPDHGADDAGARG